MGLFSFLFGRKHEADEWDECADVAAEPEEEPAGESNAETGSEAPNPEQPIDSDEMMAIMDSISIAVSESMQQETKKKSTPVRVTPVPVARRNAVPPEGSEEETALIPIVNEEIAEAEAAEDCVVPPEHSPTPTEEPEILAVEALEEEIAISCADLPPLAVEPAEPPESHAEESEEDTQDAAPTENPAIEVPVEASAIEESAAEPVEAVPEATPTKRKKKKHVLSSAEHRIEFKLHGTNKAHCIKALENCFTGQHVFLSYDSKQTRCFVYTEEGEEIGRLSKSDSKRFANEYDARIHSTYIKKIKREENRFKVKLLLLVSAQEAFSYIH